VNPISSIIQRVFVQLDGIGNYFSALMLRLLLAYEYWESGVAKFNGENWFATIQEQFPFPFNVVPVEVSWFLSTWSELLGAIALVAGLATRFFSLTLILLTVVALVSVHAGNGYNVCDNGYKLALIYLVMFIPLLLSGPGKLSLDHLIAERVKR
jgi:putative oxidoreductase